MSASEEGIFTKDQRKEMEEISQRGLATKPILHHIAMVVESNSEEKSFTIRFFGTSSSTLDPILQKANEAASAPWRLQPHSVHPQLDKDCGNHPRCSTAFQVLWGTSHHYGKR